MEKAFDVAKNIAPLELDGVVPFPEDFAKKYREKGYWEGRTLSEMFFSSVGKYSDRIVAVQGDVSITYSELGERVLYRASEFARRGISRGDRVVVHFPNCIGYLEVVFALFELGAIPVFALAAHRETEIAYFCRKSMAKGYVTVDAYEGYDFGALAQRIKLEVECVEDVLIVPYDYVSELDCRDCGEEPLLHCRRSLPSDVAFLQLSGGTTGQSKLIPRTHDDYLYTVRESVGICHLNESSVHLVVLPISHNYTMSSPGVLGCIWAGSTIILAPNGSPDVAFPLIQKHGVTSVSLVPTIALTWLNSDLKSDYDLSSLEVVQVGGAKLSEEAARRIGPELGCELQQVFGMAEGLVNYTRLDDSYETIVRTQGLRISPDDEVKLVDALGFEVDGSGPGVLLTRGPYTIRGYYDADEDNASSFTQDGFYRTGDIVKIDNRGYITVVGREKDQINRGGEKISPEEIENLLLSHDLIHDASLVGVPDGLLGEKSKAYVIPRDGVDPEKLSPFKIKKFLRGKGIASFKIPDIVEVVSSFPETNVGKVDKKNQRGRTC